MRVKLLDNVLLVRHHLVLEEENVLETLTAINGFDRFMNSNLRVGNCGWADEPTKWFMHFDVTNAKWGKIVKQLSNKFNLIIKDNSKNVYLVEKEKEERKEITIPDFKN